MQEKKESEYKKISFFEYRQRLSEILTFYFLLIDNGKEEAQAHDFRVKIQYDSSSKEDLKVNYEALLINLKKARKAEEKYSPQYQYEIEDLPTFEELDAEITSRELLGDAEYTKIKVLELIKAGESLWYQDSPIEAHGDRFIMLAALHVVLTQLAKQSDIGHPPIQFSHSGENLAKYLNPTRLHFMSENKKLNIPADHYVFSFWYKQFCQQLNIEPLSNFESERPIPLAIEDPKKVFSNYDRSSVKQVKESLKFDPDKKLVVINQSGSKRNKKFSDDHIGLIKKYFNPDLYQVVVLTDAQIGKTDVLKSSDGFYTARDMNDVSAFAELVDIIISTDTLWNWWMAGSQYFRDDEKKVEQICLYTVAGNKYHIPGVKNIVGKTLQENSLEQRAFGNSQMISPGKYIELNELDYSLDPEMAENDFLVLTDYLEQRFSSLQ